LFFVLLLYLKKDEPMRRHFPMPWTAREVAAAYVVEDVNGVRVAYVYWDDSVMQSASVSDKLTKDEARRIANAIARLPELLSGTTPDKEK